MTQHTDVRHDAALLIHHDRLTQEMARNAYHRGMAETAADTGQPAPQRRSHRRLTRRPAHAFHTHRRLASLHR
jgi:hypothetical protein